ncbi:MAG: glycosyltransferase family 4 protein [Bacteroidia bacterium]
MKIGIEAQRIFRPKKHGMDIVALELIKNLQLIDKENQYYIFVKDDIDNTVIKETENFKLVFVKSASYPIWEQLHLPKAVKKFKIDLLHCTSNTAPLKLNVPLVLTLHDIIYLEKINLSQGTAYQKFGNLYRRIIVPQIINKTSKIITVSNFENERICKHFGFNKQHVITIYNGVGSHFKPVLDIAELKNAKEKYNLPDNFVFYLGNTDPKKNVIGVLKTLIKLKKKNELNFTLVMLDINREYLLETAKKAGDESIIKHIHFTGYVPNNELPAIFSQAKLFLYPSLRESFGIPILEAMACGVPVITSNTSSMPEIAEDAAILVDPNNENEIADKITLLLNDEQLKNNLIKKGIERAKNFTWQNNALQTINVYKEVFNKN